MSEELNNRLQAIFDKKKEEKEKAEKTKLLKIAQTNENKDVVSKFITEILNPIFIEIGNQLGKNGCDVSFENTPYTVIKEHPHRIISILMRISRDGRITTTNGPKVEIVCPDYRNRTIFLNYQVHMGAGLHNAGSYNVDSPDINKIEADIYNCVENIIKQ